ncbi:hypothetical protein [Nocardia salmonicida]|uniref:Uncharacterized protein n=1 Tax=Nocardia salmonicida TaxID=53431 RepID=A0ABZ1MZV9_9NOCA|nr:hypothetical protein [Nocardia salmonicida]
MIKMQAVVEVPNFDFEPPQPWPVSSADPYSWVPINGGCSDAEVGLFVSGLTLGLEVAEPGGREDVVANLLAAETLFQPGGLRLTDTITGAVVVPGCCAGLEDWREWAEVLTGSSPWLGHDPTPEVEIGANELRVWQDSGANRRAAESVVVARSLLPDLLNEVHRDLVGFLSRVQVWTERYSLGSNGTDLVEVVDRNFDVTAPLRFQAV